MKNKLLCICVCLLLPTITWAKSESQLYEDLNALSVESKLHAIEEIEKQGLTSARIQESLVYYALYHEDSALRGASQSCLISLAGIRYLSKAHDELIEAVLVDPNQSQSRKNAIKILRGNENWAKNATKKLKESAVFDVNKDVRNNAAEAITIISGEYQNDAIQRWQAIVNNSWGLYHSTTRIRAIEALSYMPYKGPTIVPTLLNTLRDSNESVRHTLYIALQKFSEQASQIIPKLVERYRNLVNSDDYSVETEKKSILKTISELGESYKHLSEPLLLEQFRLELERFKRGEGYSYDLEDMVGFIGKIKSRAVLPEISWIALHSKHSSLREKARSVYENILTSRPSSEIPPQAEALENIKRTHENGPDICTTLCRILENIQHLSQNVNQSNIWHMTNWDTAMVSLSGLYISKVSPFCPGASSMLDDLIIRLTSDATHPAETCSNPNHPFQNLQNEVQSLLNATVASPLSATDVYAKQFFALMLRDILVRRPHLPRGQREKINELRQKVENRLKRDIDLAALSRHDAVGNSLFNTYAVATSLISLPLSQIESQNIDFLKEALDPHDPFKVAYAPRDSKKTVRASVARSVPVHLALYLKAPTPQNAQAQKQILKESLQNYIQYLPSMMVHLRRSGTHEGQDAIAPYYLFSTIPYATAATQLLLEDATPEEKEELQHIQSELKSALHALIQEDGTFYIPEYQASEYYVNPLFGLALIPLAESCIQPIQTLEPPASFNFHGILD